MSDHLLLVDASGFAFRSYYTWPALRRSSDGEPTGAVLGFMAMIWRMLGEAMHDPPTLGAAVFDAPGKNFRHKLYPEYKANRDPARALELEKQLPIMRPVADVLGLHPVEADGFEADDVIATLAARARVDGIRVTIVSSDKDFGQLVEDGHIEIVDPMQKRRMLAADVVARFGVEPALVPHVQALAGDPVDGYPGIPGCGLKRAAGLIRRWGSLEAVLANAKSIPWQSVAYEIGRRPKEARVYFKLATLRQDVPLPVAVGELPLRPIRKGDLLSVLKAMEAGHHAEAVFGLDPQMARVVERVAGPFAWWEEELKRPGQPLPEIPQCGFYMRRLVKGGPMVPARIWREPELDVEGKETGRDVLRCEVGGKDRDPMAEWVRLSMHPVKKSKHSFEMADAAHARDYRPNDPKASPEKPIEIEKLPKPTNPRSRRKALS